MELFINLVLLLVVAWLFGAGATRLGYPAILGEIAAGVIFGPPMLGLLGGGESIHEIEILAELGVFLLLLYIGMEVNYKDLLRVPKVAWLAAVGGFAAPCAMGFFGLRAYGFSFDASLLTGMILGITSLTVLSRILVDLKLLGSRMSNIMIAGSLIADTVGLILFGIYVGVVSEGTLQLKTVLIDVSKAVLFFGVVSYLGVRVFPWLGQFLKKTGFNERRANFTLVVVVGLLFALLAELAGLHAILGAFLAGLFLRGEVLARKLSHEVTGMVHDISIGFLAPIFFVMAGFHIELDALVQHWDLALIVLGLAVLGKTFGTFICFVLGGSKWRESLVIGIGMNIHGTVEIILAEIAYKEELIGADLFSIIVVVALVTTAIIPLLLKRGVAILKKRGELAGNDENRQGVLIIGAPALARFIGKAFQGYEPVWMIDRNMNRCLAAEADGLKVLRGDALKEDVLDLLDATNSRVCLAATSNHQVNEQALHNARHHYGIPECYRLYDAELEQVKEGKGDHEDVFSSLYGKGWDIEEWIARIARKETEVETWPVEETRPMLEMDNRLKNIGILPLAINRGGKRYMHTALDQAEQGDIVICLRHRKPKGSDEDPFEKLIQHCAILDLEESVPVKELFRLASRTLSGRLDMDSDKIYQLLVNREQESSTVIVPGLAIPHIMIKGKEKTEILLVRCRDGVSFFEAEEQARLIFFICGTRDERNVHLRILSAIAQLFQDPAFEDSLLTVDDPEKMREVILTTERRRF